MTARFRKVDAAIWCDPDFQELSHDGKLLWFYLLTGNEVTNLPGMIFASRTTLAEGIGWQLSRFDVAFAELERHVREDGTSMAMADWGKKFVWLPRAHLHNRPANGNAILGWRDPWKRINDCPLKARAYMVLREFVQSLGAPMLAAFDKVILEPRTRVPAVSQQTKLSINDPECIEPSEPHVSQPDRSDGLSPSVASSESLQRARAHSPAPASVPAPEEQPVGQSLARAWTPFDSQELGGIFAAALDRPQSFDVAQKAMIGATLHDLGPKNRKELEAWVVAQAKAWGPVAAKRAEEGKPVHQFAIRDWLNARAVAPPKPDRPRSPPPIPDLPPVDLEARLRGVESFSKVFADALAGGPRAAPAVTEPTEPPHAAAQGTKP